MFKQSHVNPLMPRRIAGVLLLVMWFAAPVAAQTTISYQGQLKQSSVPHTGQLDMQFRLFDQLSGGGQIGPTISHDKVAVDGGLFQVDLDFGSEAFGERVPFLEITVDGVTLIPRQTVRPSPMALFALAGNEGPPGPVGPPGSSVFTQSGNTITYFASGQEIVFRPNVGVGEGPQIEIGHSFNRSEGIGSAVLSGGKFTGANLSRGNYSVVSGGDTNHADGNYSVVSGGQGNNATNEHAVIGGGINNQVAGYFSSVGGGSNNIAGLNASYTGITVAGGTRNQALRPGDTIGGGTDNLADGRFATVPGGEENEASGYTAFAAGARAKALHAGSFVWSDNSVGNFASSGEKQFLIRATGGVGIGTNNPITAFDVRASNNSQNLFLVRTFTANTALLVHNNEGVSIGGTATPPNQGLVVIGDAGIGRNPTTNTLEVGGAASKSTAGSWLANSDARIKTDIQPIAHALEQLMLVNPVTFRYTSDYLTANQDIVDRIYYNVIAQEFAEVFPHAVKGSGEYLPGMEKTPANEILQVDTYPAEMITIAAVQELVVSFEALVRRNAELEQRLTRLESFLTDAQRKAEAQQ